MPDGVSTGRQIGLSMPRLEGRDKVTGKAEYTHTMRLPGMLHAKLFRSTVAHGRIKSIDTAAAARMPGVRGVFTAADIRKDLNSMIMYSSGQPPLAQAVLNAFYKSTAIVGKPTRNMNFSHYGDIAGNSDALMEQAFQEVDDAKRVSLLKQVQIEILRQVPAIPLPSPASNWMHNGKTMEIGFPIKAYMGTFTLGKASRL